MLDSDAMILTAGSLGQITLELGGRVLVATNLLRKKINDRKHESRKEGILTVRSSRVRNCVETTLMKYWNMYCALFV